MTLRDWQERLRWVPPLAVDAGLAAIVAAFVLVRMLGNPEPGGPAPDALGYVLGLIPAALVFARHRWPVAALLTAALVVGVYHSIGYPPLGFAVPLAAALYSVAVAGKLAWSILTAASTIAGSLAARMLVEGEPVVSVLPDTLADGALLLAIAVSGEAVRSRRAYQAEVRERLRRAELEREAEAQRRVAEERLRIARELHDVLAHTVTVISVQTVAASELIRKDPAKAEATLRTIRAASREAVAEVKAAVGVLRAGRAAPDAGGGRLGVPVPGIGQLGELVERARTGGLNIELTVAGQRREIPSVVDLTAYRIVQESLTNVQRHAQATAATVTVTFEPAAVAIEIRDDGRGPQTTQGKPGGFGVAGMRERAAALGGSLAAGAGPDGGFRVRAWLPTRRATGADAPRGHDTPESGWDILGPVAERP